MNKWISELWFVIKVTSPLWIVIGVIAILDWVGWI